MATTTSKEATTSEERTLGLVAHLLTLSVFVGVPLGNVLGPLILWLVKRDDSAFVGDHAREALNFQITLTIVTIVALVAVFATLGLGLFVVIPLLLILAPIDLILTIVAAIAAYDGRRYRYPLSLRWV